MSKEKSCRELTPEEIRNATLHYWPRLQKSINIPYTFDLSIIPQHVKDEALKEFSQSSFDPLNFHSINWVQKVLHQWEKSCKNAVKFTYVDKINTDVFNGIVIANCNNLKGANGYWQQVYTASGQFQFGLICIPSNYYDHSGELITYNLRTISHEIGHAIGLEHLFHKPGKLEEMQGYVLAGASIGYSLGIRSAFEYLFMRLGNTQVNAHLKTLAIYYSFILLKLVYSIRGGVMSLYF